MTVTVPPGDAELAVVIVNFNTGAFLERCLASELDEIRERQKQLRRTKQIGPFQYSHQGSLAYIGKERAVADISWLSGNIASGGTMTYLFWRSAYLSMCFSSK